MQLIAHHEPGGIVPAHAACPLCPPRRQVLAGLAAFGAGVALPGAGAFAQAVAGGKPHRIDVHHHVAPPNYSAALAKIGRLAKPLVGWTPEKSLADMERGGTSLAIASLTTPGVFYLDKETARRIARDSNEYMAKLRSDYPGRFGFWAIVPMPDIDGTLKEMEYALDVLKADGIGTYTSYGDKWLGDPLYAPFYQELNRRKAVLYTHPTLAACCADLMPGIPPQVIEYGTDTARAIARMLFAGTAARYPDIQIIWSHAGGTMPALIGRFETQYRVLKDKAAKVLPNGMLHELHRFHYDTAQSANAGAMSALLKLVSITQVLFGTDYPYATTKEDVDGLLSCGLLSHADMLKIDYQNAERLLPRLKA